MLEAVCSLLWTTLIKGLLDSSLKETILVFKAVRIFNPQKVAMLKPDISHVNALQIVPFFKNEELDLLEPLKAELPSYLSKADDISGDLDPLEWWKCNETALPHWSSAAGFGHSAILGCCRESILTIELWIW